jgi:hypothetical protein
MPDLTAKSLSFNRNRGAGSHNAPASRRHAAILAADLKKLIALTHGTEQQAAPATSIEIVIQIGHLDRLLDRTRRGPRSVR